MNSADSEHWLALLHQLPAKPPYLRVKIWRRLQAIGAVPLKNSVHVLPRREGADAAFHELLAEITWSGGEAVLIDTQMIGSQSEDRKNSGTGKSVLVRVVLGGGGRIKTKRCEKRWCNRRNT